MSDWTSVPTNTHQDHVIAHVIGTTVLGYFVWDETAYLLLDIGFIWNIYLNGEMGLVPQSQALAELDIDEELRSTLRRDVDILGRHAVENGPEMMRHPNITSPIQIVDFQAHNNSRRLVLTCEAGTLVVETSLETSEVLVYER